MNLRCHAEFTEDNKHEGRDLCRPCYNLCYEEAAKLQRERGWSLDDAFTVVIEHLNASDPDYHATNGSSGPTSSSAATGPEFLTETEFEKQLIGQLRRDGCSVSKIDSTKAKGAPDLCVIAPDGAVFFAELRLNGHDPEDHQNAFHRQMQRCGNAVGVWHPADWDAIISDVIP